TVVLVGGFGLIAARGQLIRTGIAVETPLSREGVFLGNNLALVALTFIVLLGIIYPLLDQALTGQQVSVGRPYFDRTTVPVMLVLLFLMAVGPLLPWRAGSPKQVLGRLRWPSWTAATIMALLVLIGMTS